MHAGRVRPIPYALLAALSVVLVWLVFLGVAYSAADVVTVAYWAVAFLGAANIVTLFFFAYDKSIAGRAVYRVPESVLLWLALVGGSPAAGLAQLLFRHKTRKGVFRLAYFAILLAQIAIALYGYEKRAYLPLMMEVPLP